MSRFAELGQAFGLTMDVKNLREAETLWGKNLEASRPAKEQFYAAAGAAHEAKQKAAEQERQRKVAEERKKAKFEADAAEALNAKGEVK